MDKEKIKYLEGLIKGGKPLIRDIKDGLKRAGKSQDGTYAGQTVAQWQARLDECESLLQKARDNVAELKRQP
jgi:hypothetical protein